ncbi:hypothetical protein DPEC_G00198640 [Dallia pectoralis]|uniref:Uncharacterized protein n=1 Tax=Dallia pectoralis TaxID=75939 RepID=A0ACC2G8D9_DALPE|nr:hypothetical protein DPEC_G00198640 [Dallia pectoralis]
MASTSVSAVLVWSSSDGGATLPTGELLIASIPGREGGQAAGGEASLLQLQEVQLREVQEQCDGTWLNTRSYRWQRKTWLGGGGKRGNDETGVS